MSKKLKDLLLKIQLAGKKDNKVKQGYFPIYHPPENLGLGLGLGLGLLGLLGLGLTLIALIALTLITLIALIALNSPK